MALVTSSSSSFTRFMVLGERPSDYRVTYLSYIRDHAFWDIDETETEESYGWVSSSDITEFEFETDACFKDEFLTLSIRVDRRKIPKPVLRLYQLKAEKEYKLKNGADELSKFQKKEILESVQKNLTKRIPPSPEVCDMVWNMITNEVYIGSTNQAAIDRFIDIFTSTFRLGLRLAYPYALGERVILDSKQRELMEELEPADFRLPNDQPVDTTGADHE